MRISSNGILAIVAAGLVRRCAVGPDYKRPAVVTPESFRGQVVHTEATSLADAPWWEAFQDPTLRQLIQEALVHNYDVQLAAARVQQARAQVGVARSQFFPPSATRGGSSATATASPPSSASRTRARRRTTSSSARSTRAGSWTSGGASGAWTRPPWRSSWPPRTRAAACLLSLVSEVAQNYFELLALDAQLEIARQSVKAFQGTYNLFRDRLEFGVVSELQTSRAQGDLGSAQARVPEVQSQIAAKENQISTLLGRPPGPVPRGLAMFAQPIVPTVPAGLALGAPDAPARPAPAPSSRWWRPMPSSEWPRPTSFPS